MRALAVNDRYKSLYTQMCAKYNKRMPNADQRNAQRLMQYDEVKREFKDEDRNATPVATATMWKWFRGERQKYIDGRAFWDAYALRCGYVDDEGAPLKPDGEQFHCDHIMTRKRERTSTEDGQGIGSFAVDHWTNYAIVWGCLNMDTEFWEGQADEVSGLKRWLHGNDAMDALDKGIAARSQAVDLNRKHMAAVLDKLGRASDAGTHMKAWEPSAKHQDLVGKVCALGRRRGLIDMLKAQAAASSTPATLVEPIQEVADMDTGSSSSDAPATPPGSPPTTSEPAASAMAAGKRPAEAKAADKKKKKKKMRGGDARSEDEDEDFFRRAKAQQEKREGAQAPKSGWWVDGEPVEAEAGPAAKKRKKKLAHEFSAWFLEAYEQDNEEDAHGNVVHFQPLKDIVEVYRKHDAFLQMKFTDRHEVKPIRFKEEFQTHSVLADAFRGQQGQARAGWQAKHKGGDRSLQAQAFSAAAADERSVGGGDEPVSEHDAGRCRCRAKSSTRRRRSTRPPSPSWASPRCNKKHWPTGSDEPFVLCEKTGGLATHSACGACSRTRSGKSHNRTSHGRSESRSRCPCDRLGVPCLHSKGDKKKRYNPKLLCARCRDGKCDYDYHQNDPKAKHFRKPPPATDAAGV